MERETSKIDNIKQSTLQETFLSIELYFAVYKTCKCRFLGGLTCFFQLLLPFFHQSTIAILMVLSFVIFSTSSFHFIFLFLVHCFSISFYFPHVLHYLSAFCLLTSERDLFPVFSLQSMCFARIYPCIRGVNYQYYRSLVYTRFCFRSKVFVSPNSVLQTSRCFVCFNHLLSYIPIYSSSITCSMIFLLTTSLDLTGFR